MQKQNNKATAGGVGLRVIVSVLTLTVLGLAIFMLLRTFESDKARDFREAMRTAEHGLEVAFERLSESPDWSTPFEDEPFEDGGSKYSVTFEREDRGGTIYLTVASTGTSGSITQSVSRTLMRRVSEVDGSMQWVPEGGGAVMPLGDLVLDDDDANADVDIAVDGGVSIEIEDEGERSEP